LALGTSLAAGPASAQQTVWDTVPSMDVVRNRLSLTPDQESKLAAIFERRAAELQKLRGQLEQASSRAQKRTILRDAKHGANAFNAEVEGLLDASQRSEWRELRAQTREKVKERYEEKRDSQ
jgi:Skp family chaperone for outer membrane proteins